MRAIRRSRHGLRSWPGLCVHMGDSRGRYKMGDVHSTVLSPEGGVRPQHPFFSPGGGQPHQSRCRRQVGNAEVAVMGMTGVREPGLL